MTTHGTMYMASVLIQAGEVADHPDRGLHWPQGPGGLLHW